MFSPNNQTNVNQPRPLADDLAFAVQNNQRGSRNRFIEAQCQDMAMQNTDMQNFDADQAMQNYETQLNDQMNGQYGNAYGGRSGIAMFLDTLGNKVKQSYQNMERKLNGENPLQALCMYICYKFLKTAAKYELKFYPSHKKSVEKGYQEGAQAIASISPTVAQEIEPISDIEPIDIQKVDPTLYSNNQKQNEGDQMQL